jgi:AbiV family abortive infection protein
MARVPAQARTEKASSGILLPACLLYTKAQHSTVLALSIACLEEIGKISVARQLAFFEHPAVFEIFRPAAAAGTPPKKNNPFYSHTQKHLIAPGAGALVNSRLDRLVGLETLISFLDDVEAEKLESLPQDCLYSDARDGKLHSPSEQIQESQARLYVVIAGELLAEVAGADTTEWERLLGKVQTFEKRFGQPFE